jgi:hypothetical protein
LGPLRLLAHRLVSIPCLLLHSHCFLLDNQIHFRPDFFHYNTLHVIFWKQNRRSECWDCCDMSSLNWTFNL